MDGLKALLLFPPSAQAQLTQPYIYSFNLNHAADPCATAPCLNGGICQRSGNNGYTCICLDGFTGDTCQTCKLDTNLLTIVSASKSLHIAEEVTIMIILY